MLATVFMALIDFYYLCFLVPYWAAMQIIESVVAWLALGAHSSAAANGASFSKDT